MNITALKQLSVLSILLGTILGLIGLVPYIGAIAIIICLFFLSTIVVLYMKNLKLIGETDTKELSISCAVSGFCGFLGFCISFLPLAAIIGLIIKTTYHYGILIMLKTGFFMVISMVLFVAIMSAAANVFVTVLGSKALDYLNSEIKK